MSAAGPLTAHRPERVAVVIPAKNEAERIEATIASARGIPGVDLVVVVGAILCGVGLLVAVPVASLILVYTYRVLNGASVAPATQ